MTAKRIGMFFICCALAQAVIVNRIAIVIGKKIIKDSDITNDLRLTAFLNREPLAFTQAREEEGRQPAAGAGFHTGRDRGRRLSPGDHRRNQDNAGELDQVSLSHGDGVQARARELRDFGG